MECILERVVKADVFSVAVNARLLAAAAQYRTVYRDRTRFYDLLGDHAPEGAGWDPERRLSGAETVRQWLAHEKTALAALAWRFLIHEERE